MWTSEPRPPVMDITGLLTSAFFLQGPEIRTGFLQDPDTPVSFTAGRTIMITTDYEHKGDANMISMRCCLLSPAPQLCVSAVCRVSNATHYSSRCALQTQIAPPPCNHQWLLTGSAVHFAAHARRGHL